MAEFTRSDAASINQIRSALEYEMVCSQDVGDKFKAGWRPMSPMIAMVPPEFLDDEMKYIANAAAALGQK